MSKKCLDINDELVSTDPLFLEIELGKVLRDAEKLEKSTLKITDGGPRIASCSTLFLIQVCEDIPYGELPNSKHPIEPLETRDGEVNWFDKRLGGRLFGRYLRHHDNRLIYAISTILIVLIFWLGYLQIMKSSVDLTNWEASYLNDHPVRVGFVYVVFFMLTLVPIVVAAIGRIWICHSAQSEIRNSIKRTFDVEANQAALSKLKKSTGNGSVK